MINNRLYLNVPYQEKEEAKRLGAKWDSKRKKWYITEKEKYHLFEKWFKETNTNLILFNHLYIVEGRKNCFKCKNAISVISIASDTIIELADEEEEKDWTEIWNDAIHFIYDITKLPETLEIYLKERYNFYLDYSKRLNSYYCANHCMNCGVLQGDFYLHGEPDSPFFIHEIEDARELKLFKLKLEENLELSASFSWSSADCLIEEYSEIRELTID